MKKFLFNILCHPLLGRLIYGVFQGKIPDLRWGGYYQMPKGIAPRLYASLFWGFYESAEKRMISRFLPADLPVIELGGSLGIVSSHISARLNPGQLHKIVEMNPKLLDYIRINSKVRNSRTNIEIINQPVAYNQGHVSVRLSQNTTESAVNMEEGVDQITELMQATTLKAVHDKIEKVAFTLVCDIEGMEIQVLMHETECLHYCSYMIIELHKTEYGGLQYSASDLISIIEKKHAFRLIARDGNVCFFNRSNHE